MTKTTVLQQASRLLRRAHRPPVACHVAPDGDALDSLTGSTRALRQPGLSPMPAYADPVAPTRDDVPGVEAIGQAVTGLLDLVITLDCSDPHRLGRLADLPHFDQGVFDNIDRQVTHVRLGDVSVVDSTASSTADALLSLLDRLDVEPDVNTTSGLLLGTVTDNGRLRTSSAASRVPKAALGLTEAGASLHLASEHSLDRRPVTEVQPFWAGLARLSLVDGGICSTRSERGDIL